MENAFGVRAIVIGGGISKEGDWFRRRVYDAMLPNVFAGETFAPALRMAALGNDAGVIGAAALEQYQ